MFNLLRAQQRRGCFVCLSVFSAQSAESVIQTIIMHIPRIKCKFFRKMYRVGREWGKMPHLRGRKERVVEHFLDWTSIEVDDSMIKVLDLLKSI